MRFFSAWASIVNESEINRTFCCLIFLECFDILCIKVVLLSVIGLGESKGRPKPSTNSPATDFPRENPSEVHVPTHLAEVPPKEVKEQETNHLLKEINKTVFPSEDAAFSHRHNHYGCAGKSCNRLSEQEVSCLSSRSRDKFDHTWLSNKSLSFCQTTGVFWLANEEGQGMFCFLCKKHNTENKNKSKAYNATPSVHLTRSAIKDHSASQQHKDATEAEMGFLVHSLFWLLIITLGELS